jgi:hypothetical protein
VVLDVPEERRGETEIGSHLVEHGGSSEHLGVGCGIQSAMLVFSGEESAGGDVQHRGSGMATDAPSPLRER